MLSWTFLISGLVAIVLLVQTISADVDVITDFNFYNESGLGLAPLQTFRTETFSLPLFQKTTYKKGVDPSDYLFFTPYQNDLPRGPMIYDARTLNPVYADLSWREVGDMRIQQYNGVDYLVFSGFRLDATYNHCMLYDSSYNLAYTVNAVNASMEVPNLHECQLTRDGTALITVDRWVPWNLTQVDGKPDGHLVDCGVQEIDIATGELMFEWWASEHVNISDSFEPIGNSTWWDFCHLNSIQKSVEGNILISMRNLNAIQYLDGKDGSTIWQLGGKNNNFQDLSNGRALDFASQHTARFIGDDLNHLTLFNDHGTKSSPVCTENCSRGMLLELDHEKMTARLKQEYEHPKHLQIGAMGSMQKLPNGNVFISWGTIPTVTEHTSDGKILAEYEWGVLADHNVASYRGFKMDWIGRPLWPPAIASHGHHVYVSWNGATEVKSWAILASDSSEDIDGPNKVIAVVEKAGFETDILVSDQRFLRAAALDTNGIVIGSSLVLDRILDSLSPADAIKSVTRCWATMFSCECAG